MIWSPAEVSDLTREKLLPGERFGMNVLEILKLEHLPSVDVSPRRGGAGGPHSRIAA